MRGKEKCRALKEIRRKIAEQNDIAFAVSECTHQGDCRGTCPKCESELRYLERELKAKQNMGKAVAIMGISMGATLTMSGCAVTEAIGEGIESIWNSANPEPSIAGDVPVNMDVDGVVPTSIEELAGDMPAPESQECSESEEPSEELGGKMSEEPTEEATDEEYILPTDDMNNDDLMGGIILEGENFDDDELLSGDVELNEEIDE